MPLPLEGVRVLDLTSVMAGPYCTMVLGDMGADVVKVENFPEGDDTSRRFDPKVNGESYCFAVLNRNKKSVALNMKDPRGKEAFMKLAAKRRHHRGELPPRRREEARHRLRQPVGRSTRASSTRRCQASARPARTARKAASTSSRRACRAS